MLFQRFMTREGYAFEPVNLEKKSVDELKPVMPKSFQDTSVQVAYKEGYNRAIEEIMKFPKY